ncbi:MAG TPA: LLM class flavin-dependent oxidoreductase [Ktedonobacteraceae bacterium]|jgi:alkanesulfonate monooxygenase SsuD/methylene tetrahydromethanopterin reductase-like flavin-dependent oxidoreductase (luciferase family)
MMRFSLFSVLDNYAHGSSSCAARYRQSLEQIVAADRHGFAACWIGEHHSALDSRQTLLCPNPAVLLVAAAQRTRRIGLNTAIANLSLRHPLLIAEDYALVDLLSDGRLGLGLGRGSFGHEYAACGQSAAESHGRFTESWNVIQQLWRGETVSFQGRYVRLEQARLNVVPVQQPLPRHWFSVIRAESFAARGRAAQPIICLPHLTAESLSTLSGLVRTYRSQYLAAGGEAESYELPLVFYTCLAPTQTEARQLGRRALHTFLAHQHQVDHADLEQQISRLEEREQLCFGTPADVIRFIEHYQSEMENRHFVFWLDFGAMEPAYASRSLELLAREVLPRFRNREEKAKKGELRT